MESEEQIDALTQGSDYTNLATSLKSLLKSRKLNANQLANQLGIPMMTIRRLLSGETLDPRISTLKLIADFFSISIDSLISGKNTNVSNSQINLKQLLVPKLTWETIENISSVNAIDLTVWPEWQSLSSREIGSISNEAFALASRPSMFPRFPNGTIFIIDPAITPQDGDTVLIKFRHNNELTLRDLIIDPPQWHLHPVVAGSRPISLSKEEHEIIGVVFLTMFYNRKNYN